MGTRFSLGAPALYGSRALWPGARKAGLKPGGRAVNLQEWTGLDCLLCKDFI